MVSSSLHKSFLELALGVASSSLLSFPSLLSFLLQELVICPICWLLDERRFRLMKTRGQFPLVGRALQVTPAPPDISQSDEEHLHREAQEDERLPTCYAERPAPGPSEHSSDQSDKQEGNAPRSVTFVPKAGFRPNA